jgi:hypothetical protein
LRRNHSHQCRQRLPASSQDGRKLKVAIFRPLGYADVERPGHQHVECFDITEEDLRRSRLPDRIERDKGSAITWTRYCELKTASEGEFPKIAPPNRSFDRQCQEACGLEAAKSIDKETTVGCVVVGPERDIQVKGHNTLPQGVAAAPERLGTRQTHLGRARGAECDL